MLAGGTPKGILLYGLRFPLGVSSKALKNLLKPLKKVRNSRLVAAQTAELFLITQISRT